MKLTSLKSTIFFLYQATFTATLTPTQVCPPGYVFSALKMLLREDPCNLSVLAFRKLR